MTFPRRTALELRQRFSTADFVTIASELGILYYEFALAPKIRGFTGVTDGQHYIVVNQLLPVHWKKATAFHELGHVLLHDTSGYFFIEHNTLFPIGKFEQQANEFAAEFLIPDNIWSNPGIDIRAVAAELAIPLELFRFKRPPQGGLSSL